MTNDITIDFNNLVGREKVLKNIKLTRNLPNRRNENYECTIQKIDLEIEGETYLDNPAFAFKIEVLDGNKSFIDRPIDQMTLFGQNRSTISINILLFPKSLKFRELDSYPDDLIENLKLKLIVQATSDDSQPISKSFDLTLNLIKENAKPFLKITKNENFRTDFQYDSREFHFGHLTISNNTEQVFAHDLKISDLNFDVRCENGNKIENAIKVENNGAKPHFTSVKPKEVSAGLKLNLDLSDSSFVPTDTHKYEVEIKGFKTIGQNDASQFIDNQDYEDCDFYIKKDDQTNGLLMCYKNPKDRITKWIDLSYSEIDEPIKLNNRTTYNPNGRREITILEGKMGNRSTNTLLDGYIKISKISRSFDSDQAPSLLRAGEKLETAFDIRVDDERPISLPFEVGGDISPLKFKPNSNSFLKFVLSINEYEFYKIFKNSDEENQLNVRLNLSFSYTLFDDNHTSAQLSPTDRNFIFDFTISRHQGDHWMVLDFGTSAIVGGYGSIQNVTVLDLQHRLSELIGEDYDSSEFQESKSRFLSSYSQIAVSNADNSLDAQFSKNPIRVSPSRAMLLNDTELILPYLKSLIGQNLLPDTTIKQLDEKGLANLKALMPNDIIESVYRILLNDYIKPLLGDDKEKNKLVLTVPNLFSIRHQRVLREIVSSVFSDSIWDNYIKFVSESDAVAFYYLKNHYDITAEAETVMVYDMGAGTLDITVFKIYKEDKKRTLQILAKSGSTCAGNYLDSILADIFHEEFLKGNEQIRDGTDESKRSQIKAWTPFKDARNEPKIFEYKTFIKNAIKPSLTNSSSDKIASTEEFKLNDASFTITDDKDKGYALNNLVNSDSFTAYLDKVTDEQFNIIKRSFNLDQEEIDKVIMTGRASQLYSLNNKVKRSIKEVFGNDCEIIPTPSNELKSSVAEGALYYINNQYVNRINFKPLVLSVRYGLLKTLDGNSFEYEELINPDSPLKDNPDGFHTSERGVFIERKIDINGVVAMSLIQTFESDPYVIEKRRKEGTLFEVSSEIVELKNHSDGLSETYNSDLKLFVALSGEIFYEFVGTGEGKTKDTQLQTQFVHYESESFKRSMWPFI